MKADRPNEGANSARPKARGRFAIRPDGNLRISCHRGDSPPIAGQGPHLAVGPEDRLAPKRTEPSHNLALLVGCSLLFHAALFLAFFREVSPPDSIGEVAISVDVVIGTDTHASVTQALEESEERTAKQIAANSKAAEKPVVSTPKGEIEAGEQRKPASGTTSTEQKKMAKSPSASTPSLASSDIRGRSNADINYRGLVAAHLARHRQFPADARSRGDVGTTLVTFTLDGGGAVTSINLMRGSGIASFDHETQAMVRRASPFPAPPSGLPMTFTVPIRFYLFFNGDVE